jgi:cytochrome c2
MKKIAFIITLLSVLIFSCKDDKSTTEDSVTVASNSESKEYDVEKGIGFWTAENLKLSETIDTALATKGELLHNLHCASCHNLNSETLVGPGWKGILKRRKPEWIMNYINNPDAMIDKDPKLKKEYEKCYIRMPDPHLSEADARSLLEFIRLNETKG